MISVGNLIHRSIVFGAIGFGVYGTVVITQNMLVKRQRLIEYEAAEASKKREIEAQMPGHGPLPPKA